MSISKMYVIKDRLAGVAGPIYLAHNDEVAKRMFKKIISEHGIEAGDYELLYVGMYNDETQVIDASCPIKVDMPLAQRIEFAQEVEK